MYFLTFQIIRVPSILQIEAGLLHKEYIAKVLGVFPEGEVYIFIF